MSPVLDRDALEQSPLADLHVIAAEIGLDGFRRLRKADLVDAIVAKQSGEEPAAGDADTTSDDDGEERGGRRRSRGGRGRGRAKRDEDPGDDVEAVSDADTDTDADADADAEAKERGGRRRSRAGRDDDGDERGGRSRSRGGRDDDEDRGGRSRSRGGRDDDGEERTVEGVVELLPNGSGFVRVKEGETSDDDVYISAAQVKRCELVNGDKVGGPVRSPRRSERYPSLVRVESINGSAADEVAEGTRFDDLPAAFPAERLALGGEDPTVKAIEWLTPFGKGSRVVITGPARSGKTEALRRVVTPLAGQEGLEVLVVLAGVRPEEIADWKADGLPEPVSASSFASSADQLAQSVEQAVERARRVAARGGDAVVAIDSLELLSPSAARRALAAARNIVDGGSLTVIATAAAPLGGETTVIALNPTLTSLGRFPALDLEASGTMRPELLVGDAGGEAIAKARADALA